MRREAAYHQNIELIIVDADNNSQTQIQQINELITQGIDLLIVSPNESAPVTNVVVNAHKKGIPTIIIDRKIDSEEFTAYIGANNFEIGKSLGRYLAEVLHGQGQILEVEGLEGSSPALERHNGFVEAIKDYPKMKIVGSFDGEWRYNIAKSNMQNWQVSSFNVVYGHNDVMALAAQEILAESGRTDSVFFIGIDALPELGVKLVDQGVLNASFLYPTGGERAIELAFAILEGQKFEKYNTLRTAVVDKSNAHVLQLQHEQVLAHQNQIEKQIALLAEQRLLYNNQANTLKVFIIGVGLLVVLALALVYVYMLTVRQNKQLAEKNSAIQQQSLTLEKQNEEIREMNEKVEAATQAKIRFFTNISHEIRTPLTLIQAPLLQILDQMGQAETQWRQPLEMMRVNTERLLRLVNQLMDFRKIELGKTKLEPRQAELINFVRSIFEAYKPLAEKKQIRYTFETDLAELHYWFDPDKLDKTLFNLLSNAFKFTPSGGEVNMRLYINSDWVFVHVADTGAGIPYAEQQRVFERFYQQAGHQHNGTGIGLSLSREFVNLHGGKIILKSEPDKGSTFTVVLPRNPDYDVAKTGQQIVESQYTSGSMVADTAWQASVPTLASGSHILIVEDDNELRMYLQSLLSTRFRVDAVSNGVEALEVLELDPPELVLTDWMMPEMDGLELCRRIKIKVETSHIPVVLLTARSNDSQKIEGIEHGADDYLEKPFNPEYLLVRLRKLIESREKLRSYFQSLEPESGIPEPVVSPYDKAFLNRVHAVLEKFFSDSNFSVEKFGSELGLSRIHLYRKLKAITGFSPNEYLNRYRLQKAQELMQRTAMNVNEVAFEVGFASHAYFSKKFKEFYKKSPSDYLADNGSH